ncbi:hypothetical protein DIPPA_11640 [Diplonema papillatum]|nr:hypothetical protein DIPPA_11640 [Diplonema papillatum]
MIGNDLEACCRGAGVSAAEAVPRGYRHLSPVDVLEENQDLKTIRNPYPSRRRWPAARAARW